MRSHSYAVNVSWTGNLGTGTSDYRAYSRANEVTAAGPPPLPGSSEPTFRGDPARWNPEQLLVASLSQCHLLWYLHLCAVGGVVVTAYEDAATGTMVETPDGGGHFTEVTLHPRVTVASSEMVDRAVELHDQAHKHCFIASSVNFAVRHEPSVTSAA